MAIQYDGSIVMLMEELPVLPDAAAVQVLWVLEAEVTDSETLPIPPELQKLLDEYSHFALYSNEILI
jgi:hypothetical protein